MTKMTRKEREACTLCCIIIVIIALAIFYWFISIPLIAIYLYYRYRKKNPKEKKLKNKLEAKWEKSRETYKPDKKPTTSLPKKTTKCNYCGTELGYNESYCKMCGNWQGIKSPTICGYCGQILKSGDSGFCKSCGNWYKKD